MATFNPYFPVGYQPYGQGFYQNPYAQQTQIQQQQPNVPSQIQQNGIIWVGSDSEADAYPIAPNNAVTLWSRSAPIVYFKQADASGRPSMRIYELVERSKGPQEATSSQGDKLTPQYATKDEIEAITAVVDGVKNEIKQIKNDAVPPENEVECS